MNSAIIFLCHPERRSTTLLAFFSLLALVFTAACSQSNPSPRLAEAESAPSPVSVLVNPGGPVSIRTTAAEFDVLPSGYVKALLMKDGKKLSLDEPASSDPASADFVVTGGKEAHFMLDFSQTRIVAAQGKLGPGKRVEIPAQPLGPAGAGLASTCAIELYDNFP